MSLQSLKSPMVVAFFATLLVISAIAIRERVWEKIPATNNDQVQMIKDQQQLLLSESKREIDTDNDGLPDWQERLYGSDILVSDTDGDGTSDGDEVFARRDPTKKGPNDKLTMLVDPNIATSSTDIDGIRKEYIIKTVLKNLETTDEETVRELVKKLDPKLFRARFEVIDLNVASASDDAALREYGNAFGVLIKKYTTVEHRNEEGILADALPKKSTEALKELQYPAITYRAFTDDLRKLAVPLPLADAHLRIVNGYDIMARAVLNMQKIYTDPIVGAAAYQMYLKQRIEVTQGYAELVNQFREKNIVFEKTESGAPFTWPPTAASTNQQ